MRTKLTSLLISELVMGFLLFLILFPKEGLFFEFLWIVVGAFFLLYLPGYWIGYLFFSEDALSAFERFVLNFLISFTLLVLISYYLYYTGVGISNIKIYLITFIIVGISIISTLIRWRGYPDAFEESIQITQALDASSEGNELENVGTVT